MMSQIEVDDESLDLIDAQTYKEELNLVKKLLSEEGDETSSHKKVLNSLGNDISVLKSVLTEIFCFLRAQKPISGIKTENPLRRTIQYAMNLSGDSDTIGSMTEAIAGAFYREVKISPNVLSHCETSDDFEQLADELFNVATAAE